MNSPWRLLERETGRVVVERLEVADRFWSRLCGWQFRRRPPAGAGLLLVPCASVHTGWLRFPLDLLALDRHGTVLAVRRELRPWRLLLPPNGTYAMLELPGGEGAKVLPGVRLKVDVDVQTPPANRPTSLRFLAD